MKSSSSNDPIQFVQEFTGRTSHIIGRKEETERLHQYLHTGDERQIVYYWARGGLGKTRLLEELQGMIAAENESRGGFHTTGIIDLYHTDTHSTSDVERIIVERLDPGNRYFAAYRRARRRYEVLRERGTDPLTLESYRKELARHFTEGYRDMSVDARKIVLCFDTIELLQYESSIVEEKAGLDTSDTRLKPWLLDKLSQLPKALIVLAGRPQLPPPEEEQSDPQTRLVEDLQAAFGNELKIIELEPFTLNETQAFLTTLVDEARSSTKDTSQPNEQIDETIIPPDYLPTIHRLTGGRPIFLHLVFDLIWNLSLAPQEVLDLFAEYRELVDAPEDSPRLEEAREVMETRILETIFNETGPLGEYLKRIALLPKGVDVEILGASLGLPQDEAGELLNSLEPLSFIKHFTALPGSVRVHPERTFLHDELYRLLTSQIIPYLNIAERQVATAVLRSFYDPQISALRRQIDQSSPAERIPLRERLQKLQVERLYYLLISDVRRGYTEYKKLTDEANRRRWVGFGMRLLDEFLRFYNNPERRPLFERAGISHDQIVRESAELWCERFSWWKQRARGIAFSEKVIASPGDFFIDPDEHAALWGNVHALWGLARGVMHGYEAGVAEQLRASLNKLPPASESNVAQLLARARLTNAIGFALDRGGRLAQSVLWYSRSKAAYQELDPGYDPEGYTSLLNNLAYGYALQGRMTLARTIGHEALRINQETGNQYTMGLTLSTLSTIAVMRGNYAMGVEYGEASLTLFENLEDAYGTVLAYYSIARAKRRRAKHELVKGWDTKLPEVELELSSAKETLEKALGIAENAGLVNRLSALYAEYGRLHRDLGRLWMEDEGIEAGLPAFHTGARYLQRALESQQLGVADRADLLEDLAEIQFLAEDVEGAQARIREAEALIPAIYQTGGSPSDQDLVESEYYAPLAKLEMLKGQMAFEGDSEEIKAGLQHYLLAYVYFNRFSQEPGEQTELVERVYRRLSELSNEHQRELLSGAVDWLADEELEDDARPFLDDLRALVGY